MIRVYTTSKLSRAATWRRLAETWQCAHFHARWLKYDLIGTPDTAEHAAKFWLEDQEDVACADVVLVWAEEGEYLRGALVEAGMALAAGVPVVVVGEHPDYGTWQHHPNVVRATDIDDAHEILRKMDEGEDE